MKSNLVEQQQNEQTQKGISINNLLLEDTEAINENLLKSIKKDLFKKVG